MTALMLEPRNDQVERKIHHAEEEQCRNKIISLRDGLRRVFEVRGVPLSEGTSNVDFLWSVAALIGKPRPEFSEHPSASWKDEYESVVRAIGSLLGSGTFTADTPPQDIVNVISSRNKPTQQNKEEES